MGGEGCRKRADNEADIEEESVEDDDDEKADDDGEESAVAEVVKKWKGKTAKKKPGRKPKWCPKALDDFIDIVVNKSHNCPKQICNGSLSLPSIQKNKNS